jgi:hypothetical protein
MSLITSLDGGIVWFVFVSFELWNLHSIFFCHIGFLVTSFIVYLYVVVQHMMKGKQKIMKIKKLVQIYT